MPSLLTVFKIKCPRNVFLVLVSTFFNAKLTVLVFCFVHPKSLSEDALSLRTVFNIREY